MTKLLITPPSACHLTPRLPQLTQQTLRPVYSLNMLLCENTEDCTKVLIDIGLHSATSTYWTNFNQTFKSSLCYSSSNDWNVSSELEAPPSYINFVSG